MDDKMFEDFLQKVFQTPSAIALIISNLIPVIGVFFLGWNAGEILLLYWAESAVIGFYTVLKISHARGKPKGLNIGGKEVVIKNEGDRNKLKFILIPFFALHFGIFMLGHLVFVLLIAALSGGVGFNALSLGLLAFFISHGISFKLNFVDGKEYEKANPGMLFLSPYARIAAMHLAIIFGFLLFIFSINGPVIILVLIKTFFDLLAHLAEHNKFQAQKINGRYK